MRPRPKRPGQAMSEKAAAKRLAAFKAQALRTLLALERAGYTIDWSQAGVSRPEPTEDQG